MTPRPPPTSVQARQPEGVDRRRLGCDCWRGKCRGGLRLTRNEKPVPDTSAEASSGARLRRLGVIDVGSNSIRLVVFDGVTRSPACIFNEKVLCGLGAGLGETGRLSREGWSRAITALHRFTGLAERMQVSGLIAVATAAVREATDGRAFCDDVERQTGLQLQIASGAEEGRLSAKGVLLGWPRAEGLVCDMGGSSMELARISGGEIGACATSPLGPLKLADFTDPEKRERYIRKQVRALCKAVGESDRIFLVGGSWRAIARLDMERVGYPLTVLHGYDPPVAQLLETLPWIRAQDPAALAARSGVSAARLALVPLATLALSEVIRRVDPQRVTISAYGLREGLLYRQMSEEMRNLDPLIDTARHLEALHARAPGFGEALCAWLSPLFAGSSAADLRLLRAACLLHDINWRVHPDYRAGLCLESITRANIAGIDHQERVFLGIALLNRYSASGAVDAGRYLPIIGPERAERAVILGRAMRLGAMLSGSATGVLDNTSLTIDADRLVLDLKGDVARFAGEAVERRLASLAQKMNLAPLLTLS